MLVSIFNDVLGPVMRGPSSSHCAAALRIGRLARDLMGGEIDDVLVEFDRAGSLPTTHHSQGSDMGLFGGLLGWDAADERLPGSMETFAQAGARIRIATVDVGDPHPNTYRLTLRNDHVRHALRAISTGGGMIEVIAIDGATVSIFGDYVETLLWVTTSQDSELNATEIRRRVSAIDRDAIGLVDLSTLAIENGLLLRVTSREPLPAEVLERFRADGLCDLVRTLNPVLPVRSHRGMRVPFETCNAMLAHDAGRGTALWQLAVEYESLRGQLHEDEVIAMMTEIVRILRRSIAAGIAGTSYEDRVLPSQAPDFERRMAAGGLLDAGALNQIVLAVTALMEVKSSMGVIVAMPTAGACAALPGSVIAMAEAMGLGEQEMVRAFLASGLIGVFIASQFSFAAEVGGCQAEGGSASAMAAAALVTLAGGTLPQTVAAASMALQSMIGLICDPIASRVEAPCLGKNVMAAANAVCCANMSLAGFQEVVPLDEVILTAKRVASQMPRELRCTALGGLSITPASIAIQTRLEQLASTRKASCGTGTCGCGCG